MGLAVKVNSADKQARQYTNQHGLLSLTTLKSQIFLGSPPDLLTNPLVLTVENLWQIDPKTTESLRGASMIMTEKEAKLAKEYQALKDRNQLMEAQLESFR